MTKPISPPNSGASVDAAPLSSASAGAHTLDLALFERASDEDIEAYIAELPQEQVPAALFLITRFKKALAVGEKMATSRMESDQILGVGEVWTAPDGSEHMWTGDRHREVTDAEGLRAALLQAHTNGELSTLAERALKSTFKVEIKTYLTELDRIVKFAPAVADIVREFTTWKSGPNKLRPLDAGGRDR